MCGKMFVHITNSSNNSAAHKMACGMVYYYCRHRMFAAQVCGIDAVYIKTCLYNAEIGSVVPEPAAESALFCRWFNYREAPAHKHKTGQTENFNAVGICLLKRCVFQRRGYNGNAVSVADKFLCKGVCIALNTAYSGQILGRKNNKFHLKTSLEIQKT